MLNWHWKNHWYQQMFDLYSKTHLCISCHVPKIMIFLLTKGSRDIYFCFSVLCATHFWCLGSFQISNYFYCTAEERGNQAYPSRTLPGYYTFTILQHQMVHFPNHIVNPFCSSPLAKTRLISNGWFNEHVSYSRRKANR